MEALRCEVSRQQQQHENEGDVHNVYRNRGKEYNNRKGNTNTKKNDLFVQGIGEDALREVRSDEELMEVVDAMMTLRAREAEKHVVVEGLDNVLVKAVCRAVDARGRCLQRVLSQMESLPPNVLAALRNHVLALDVSGADASAAAFQLMPALMRPGMHVGMRDAGLGEADTAAGDEGAQSAHDQPQLGIMTDDEVLEAWTSKAWAPSP